MGTSSGAYELRVRRDKTRVKMFYFDSNTIVPLQCAALVFWKAYVDRMSDGWLLLGIPITFHLRRLLNLNLASGPMNVFRIIISMDVRFNFYKYDFAVLKFY